MNINLHTMGNVAPKEGNGGGSPGQSRSNLGESSTVRSPMKQSYRRTINE